MGNQQPINVKKKGVTIMAKAITIQELNQRLKTRFPTEQFSIKHYESLGKPAVFTCKNCHQDKKVNKASNFFAKNKTFGCKNCNGLWKYREKNLELLKEKYDIIKTFVKDTHTHYLIKCKSCGHERCSTLLNLIRHLDCGCQTGVLRNRTAQEFITEVNKFNNNEYELVSDYKNQTTKVLLRHKPCNFIWRVRPADIIHGRSHCPKCSKIESFGCRLISTLLTEANILYEKEKTLNNSKQRFDFYIEKSNLKIAIEYNGVQHYQEVQYFNTPLAVQQDRDRKKAQYCKDNNIELIVIPYSFSKEEIISCINSLINRLNDYPEKE